MNDISAPAVAAPNSPVQTMDPATRIFTTERFTLTADRRQTAFVSMRSGLSHDGGHIQYHLTPLEAIELAHELQAAAAYASVPTLADKIRASKEP